MSMGSEGSGGDTLAVGRRLVELCKAGKNLEAVDALYADDIVSVEAQGSPAMPAETQGKAAVRGRNQWWLDNHEVHTAVTEGPYPHGYRFAVWFKYDVTAKAGPMAGKRFTIAEVALYTVKGGKIVKEEFFYHMG